MTQCGSSCLTWDWPCHFVRASWRMKLLLGCGIHNPESMFSTPNLCQYRRNWIFSKRSHHYGSTCTILQSVWSGCILQQRGIHIRLRTGLLRNWEMHFWKSLVKERSCDGKRKRRSYERFIRAHLAGSLQQGDGQVGLVWGVHEICGGLDHLQSLVAFAGELLPEDKSLHCHLIMYYS